MRTETNMHERYIPSPVMECGLWLRAGILGVGVAALAVVLLFNGDANPLLAIGWALAAGAFSVFSVRRAWSVLDESADAPSTAKAPSQPVVVTQARRQDRPALQL